MQQSDNTSQNRLTHLEGMELPKGNYLLERLISVSNMSVIYKAVDRSSRRYVAVKVLLTKRYLQRFKNEVEISWGHRRNIASALRFELDGERLADGTTVRYMVMKWLSGPSLSERIKALKTSGAGTADLLRFCDRLLSKVASALDELHEIGLVHLDVKPSNILFNSDEFETDEPYLIDFGIAQWLNVRAEEATMVEEDGADINTRITPENEVVNEGSDRPGTANYMPPEQWHGSVQSGLTDQYALAITIYEILSGRISPYHEALTSLELTTGSGSSPLERRAAWQRVHEEEMPTPLTRYRPDLPRGVWRVLSKAMDKNPDKRYPTILAFSQAFHQATASMMDARKSRRLLDADQPTIPDRTALPKPNRRHTGLWMAAAIALIMVGAALIMLLVTAPPDSALSPAIAVAAETETADAFAAETNSSSPSSTVDNPDVVIATVTAEPEATLMPSLTASSTTFAPSPTATATRTHTPTSTPSTTPTLTLTATATRTDSPTPTAVPRSARDIVEVLFNASRSANNFDCVTFILDYDALVHYVETGADADEQDVLMSLFSERGTPLAALYAFCEREPQRSDRAAQLPSSLANDAFRDARSLLRTVLISLTE